MAGKNSQGLSKSDLADLKAWQKNSDVQVGPGAPKGNANALKSGIFSNKVLDPDELKLYRAIIDALNEDFTFNRSSDRLQCELVGVNYVKLARAFAAGDFENAERIDRMVRYHLKDLKATKSAREGETTKNEPQTTPAEWATALLERVAEAKIELSSDDPEADADAAEKPKSRKRRKK
ncbi:hypothetical protein SCOR_15265 [Sulfidibacter corallicola]|uniref:Uncharacterized protein n=1 Tax=Sulfidibacter corallicola TaxID=2818388 RepID=A0A8A4TYZ4_SULCO|nr:hypothetical protein [Sulfidibacter corallicola]QTD54172.1 hypothetical protein J3U87_17135 [Sulfidibacter corallicola]